MRKLWSELHIVVQILNTIVRTCVMTVATLKPKWWKSSEERWIK